jgi:hypothetical protein
LGAGTGGSGDAAGAITTVTSSTAGTGDNGMRSVMGHPSPADGRSSPRASGAGDEISLWPQPLQNFAPSRFSVWQEAHTTAICSDSDAKSFRSPQRASAG